MSKASSDAGLLLYLAVGRETNGRPELISTYLSKKGDPKASVYEDNAQKLISKSHKLTNGKRLRLTSDELGFEIHVLCSEENGSKLLFIAMVSEDFGVHHVISTFVEDWKSSFTKSIPTSEWKSSKSSISSRASRCLEAIGQKYNTSSILKVNAKVDEVKDVMRNNVDMALANVDRLQELDEKSANIEASSRQFHSNAKRVKCAMCAQYWKLIVLGVLIAAIILTIIIVVLVKK